MHRVAYGDGSPLGPDNASWLAAAPGSAKFQKFEVLDDLKTLQLVTLLRVLRGKSTGKLDFLPTTPLVP